jgi:hypothetical protein
MIRLAAYRARGLSTATSLAVAMLWYHHKQGSGLEIFPPKMHDFDKLDGIRLARFVSCKKLQIWKSVQLNATMYQSALNVNARTHVPAKFKPPSFKRDSWKYY